MPGLVRYLLIIILGYCIGSFPTAFLIVKRKRGLDIRQAGSRFVGGMNAFDVTRSVPLAAVIVVIDMVKGSAAVLITGLLFGWHYHELSVAGLSAVAGHSFPVWLGFHGGRGLATAAGVLFVLGWFVVAVWAVTWAVIYGISRNIHLANIIAIVSIPVAIPLIPGFFMRSFEWQDASEPALFLFGVSLAGLLLLRHLDVLKNMLIVHHNA